MKRHWPWIVVAFLKGVVGHINSPYRGYPQWVEATLSGVHFVLLVGTMFLIFRAMCSYAKEHEVP